MVKERGFELLFAVGRRGLEEEEVVIEVWIQEWRLRL